MDNEVCDKLKLLSYKSSYSYSYSYTPISHVCHSGDGESHTGRGEIFEHPTKTWACATHKQAVAVAVAVSVSLSHNLIHAEPWIDWID
jgi:hypothetical protein